MTNYMEEFNHVLSLHDYTIDNIVWIGTSDFKIPISEFIKVATNTVYNAGFGQPETPSDIVVVMDDNSYFERREYDGAEYWFHKNPLREPHTTFHLSADTFNYIDAKIDLYNWAPTLIEYCGESD